jgi:thioredoxin family protein
MRASTDNRQVRRTGPRPTTRNGTVDGTRLHQMIRQPGPVIDRTFEITFSDLGAQVYAFTFG